jgi:hypothetical protein
MFDTSLNEKQFETGLRVLAAFGMLQQHAPGTAFLFARLLYNSQKMIADSSIAVDDKIAFIEVALREPGLDLPSHLAARFCRLLLDAERTKDLSAAVLAGAFATIAGQGACYRDLEARDYTPIEDQHVHSVLSGHGFTRVGDYIAAMRAEGIRIGQEQAEIECDVTNALGLLDARQEQSKGVARPYLAAIETLLPETQPTDVARIAAASRFQSARCETQEFEHLPCNDFDVAGIRAVISRYKTAGLRANIDIQHKNSGIIRIIFDNPIKRDGSAAMFELHKLARRTLFRKKSRWVVQMYSAENDGQIPMPHGCVVGATLATALSEAEADLQFNYMSILSFREAAQLK